MRLPLSPIALALLALRQPARSPPASPPVLRALLREQGYPVHPAVLTFERDFGGLRFSEPEGGGGEWLLGAHACLRSGAHAEPRGGPGQKRLGLVPVAYAASDAISYLDPWGRLWLAPAGERAKAALTAPAARTWVTRLLLGESLLPLASATLSLAGRRGAGLARALRLPELPDASAQDERWWSDGRSTIVERRRATAVTCREPEQLALARAASARKRRRFAAAAPFTLRNLEVGPFGPQRVRHPG